MKSFIIDTGPLVAWLCKRDSHHQWAQRTLDILPSGIFTTESVLTETFHLVARDGVPPSKLLRLMDRGDLIVLSLSQEMSGVQILMEKYADTPMDFADACVTRLAELHDDAAVCTTDTDFLVYRKSSGDPIPLIAPFVPAS